MEEPRSSQPETVADVLPKAFALWRDGLNRSAQEALDRTVGLNDYTRLGALVMDALGLGPDEPAP